MDGDISGWSKDLLFFHADSREENLDIKIEVEEVINASKKNIESTLFILFLKVINLSKLNNFVL